MTAHPLSEAEILLRIAPGSARWPKAETAAWVRLRAVVDAFRSAAVAIDAACAVADEDKALSLSGARAKKAAIGKGALADLESNKLLQSALKFASDDITNFENKITAALPPKPTEAVDALLHQELRAIVRGSKSPIDAAVRGLSDPRITAAIIWAPAMASGLSDAEHALVRARARTNAAPTQAEAAAQLSKARADVTESAAALRRLIKERTGLDEHELPPLRPPAPVAAAG